jgi:predicted amidophosphoribosyltransferase
MNLSDKLLWFGLRACLYCGSLSRNSDGLCKVCSENLWEWQPKEYGLFRQEIEKLEVASLFHWVPGKQEVLSRLARALKGEGSESLWQFYAEEFWARKLLDHKETKVKPLLLIPSPSKNLRKDHAAFFTQSLVSVSGGTPYPCLRRGELGSQKEKSRSERFRARLEWSEDFTQSEFNQNSRGKQVVFIDDIVTTGATAKAAWKTLGKPRDFAVWSLAQRGLSCGASTDLV